MKAPRALLPKDITTLARARDVLDRSRPIGDERMVDRLRGISHDPSAARARLEDAGPLRPHRSGWASCADRPPLIFSIYGW